MLGGADVACCGDAVEEGEEEEEEGREIVIVRWGGKSDLVGFRGGIVNPSFFFILGVIGLVGIWWWFVYGASTSAKQ